MGLMDRSDLACVTKPLPEFYVQVDRPVDARCRSSGSPREEREILAQRPPHLGPPGLAQDLGQPGLVGAPVLALHLHLDQIGPVRPGLVEHEAGRVVRVPVQRRVDEGRLVPLASSTGPSRRRNSSSHPSLTSRVTTTLSRASSSPLIATPLPRRRHLDVCPSNQPIATPHSTTPRRQRPPSCLRRPLSPRSGSRLAAAPPPPSARLPENHYRPVNAALTPAPGHVLLLGP